MPLFGAGIQGQIYGYGLNPGLIKRILVRCITLGLLPDPAIALSFADQTAVLSFLSAGTVSFNWLAVTLAIAFSQEQLVALQVAVNSSEVVIDGVRNC